MDDIRDLGTVESTLFVPMIGRIYASEVCPEILSDKKALDLKDKLPKDLLKENTQNQYTCLASASRSANMDRYIKDFLMHKPNGVIVQLGVGLETTYYRNDNGKTKWYGVDLEHVIEYRKSLLPDAERETSISGDAFTKEWIEKVRSEIKDAPILVTASGLFYYFEEKQIIDLFKMLIPYGDIEIVFDTVNEKGMMMMRKMWLKKVGHEDAKMFFYVNNANDLIAKVGEKVKVIAEEPYYKNIKKKGLKLFTKIGMKISDKHNMVKMIHLGFNQ